MMTYLGGMVLCAVLFVLLGLIRPRTECNNSSCGGCGLVCHRREDPGEVHHD